MVQLEEELAIKPHNLHLAPATHIGEGEKSLTSCPCLTPATHVGEEESHKVSIGFSTCTLAHGYSHIHKYTCKII